MKKMFVAVLVASCAGVPTAFAERGETGERTERGGLRAEMRELIRGDGMDVAALANLLMERGQARFSEIDADGDGIVTRADFLALSATRAETMFERMGPNEDGVVTRIERRGHGRHDGPRAERREGRGGSSEQRAERAFDRMDADGDGMISREEFAAAMESRGERRAEWRERRSERAEQRAERRAERGGERSAEGPRGPHGEMRAEMRELMRAGGMDLAAFQGLVEKQAGARFDRLDADGNGELTAEEFTANVADRAERMFARMDRNDDGIVDRDDRRGWGKGAPRP